MTYAFLMYMKAAGLILISSLAGCAAGGAPQILVSTRTVDTSQAFALPPPGGPSIVSVIERPYNNAVQQEILLATSARTPGQNVLRVQFFGPVKANLSGGDKLRDSQLGVTDISREMRGTLPGIAMHRSPNYVQNRYGPFGYRVGAVTLRRYMRLCVAAHPPRGKPEPLADRPGIHSGSIAAV